MGPESPFAVAVGSSQASRRREIDFGDRAVGIDYISLAAGRVDREAR